MAKFSLVIAHFAGIRTGEMTKLMYTRAALRINSAMKIVAIGFFPAPVMHLSPFVTVFVHLCMRSYTIDSWIFYYGVW